LDVTTLLEEGGEGVWEGGGMRLEGENDIHEYLTVSTTTTTTTTTTTAKTTTTTATTTNYSLCTLHLVENCNRYTVV